MSGAGEAEDLGPGTFQEVAERIEDERPRPTTIERAVEVLVYRVRDEATASHYRDRCEQDLEEAVREVREANRRSGLARRDLLDLVTSHADGRVRSALRAHGWHSASAASAPGTVGAAIRAFRGEEPTGLPQQVDPSGLLRPAPDSPGLVSVASPAVSGGPFVGPLGATLCSLASCREPTDGRRDGFDSPKCVKHGGLNAAQREQLAAERAEWARQERVLDRDGPPARGERAPGNA